MTRPPLDPISRVPAATESRARSTESERTGVLILGINLWLVMTAIPATILQDWGGLGLSVATLAPLALGVVLLRDRAPFEGDRARFFATVCLLGLVPTAALTVVMRLDRSAAGASHPPLALGLGSASLLAYLAVTAAVLARPIERSDVRHRDMKALSETDDDGGRRWRRRLVLGVAGAGALTLALVAPYLGGRGALVRAWGDASDAAGTLAATVGGALGALVLGAFVGPGLRRQPPPSLERRRWRVTLFVLVALSGVVVHALLDRG